ncbi:Alpha/Beta hydrolase protein [Jimgerdemannia flammicorona]|uniref:S-formylglutathione hydrolase n=1 Tax=Jimgerdemannia flammicorona TaxID=994334 RepID=A0A433Q8P8_9FUNG|nr:Alpha/Beta hydrolase protein [Jimgerdemannia flammicorona]
MTALTKLSRNKAYDGHITKYSHNSAELACTMQLNVFLPKAADHGKVPAIYCLAGLTCTEDNFAQKAGALREAAKHGLALIFPDTSPSAGFYLNATEPKWSKHYRMYSYIVDELPSILNAELPITASALSPIVNPINCPWGQKALTGYLGNADKEAWRQYDATELLKDLDRDTKVNVLVDVGTADQFLERELLIPNLRAAAEETGRTDQFTIRMQEGYDHSYFFVASVIEDHVAHHAKHLKA